jgi:hypothetical protein
VGRPSESRSEPYSICSTCSAFLGVALGLEVEVGIDIAIERTILAGITDPFYLDIKNIAGFGR